MTSFNKGDSERRNDGEDLAELDECIQLLAAGAGREELEAVATDLDNEQAGLLRRLARHFTSTQMSSGPVAADGHAIPDRVGRFRILREIGSGGFGVVYLARDETIGRDVAVKLPRRDLMRDSTRRQQLIHEARTAGGLEHPGIIPVYESGSDGETAYIVSSYCDGPDLATWQGLQTEPPSPVEAASFVCKLAEAVAYAHTQGVVHRDIKPSNVLLARDLSTSAAVERNASHNLATCQPRLTDFGLARLADEPITDTRSSLIVGTPLYMAPEQLLPDLGPVTERTDIYSLGILLAELLVGKPLLSGKTYIEILTLFQNEAPVGASLVPAHIPRDLRTIIIKCMSRTPENRFVSADALARDLSAFVEGRPISVRRATILNQAVTWCRDARRTRESCVFTVGAMICMTSWVLYSLWLVWSPFFPGEDPRQTTRQSVGIICTINLPVMVLAYLGLGQRIWAMLTAALLLLIGSVCVPALIITDKIGLLDTVYGPYPYFKKSFHSFILFVAVTQIVYLAIGIYAHRWNVKRSQTTG